MNKEVRPFEEYKEIIQDMSKDNMIKGLYDLSANIIEKDKEIDRLNNILEEFEKELKKDMDVYICGRANGKTFIFVEKIVKAFYLDKLKELKEGK